MSDSSLRSGLVRVLTIGLAASATIGLAVGTVTSTDPTAGPGAPSPPPSIAPEAVALGQPFDLAVGELAVAGGELHVRLVAVTEDSRCPLDVQCVWEGNAAVALEVSTAGAGPDVLSLDTNPGFTTAADYDGYTIRLIDLEPYPRTDTRSDDVYRAILVVEAAIVGPPKATDMVRAG